MKQRARNGIFLLSALLSAEVSICLEQIRADGGLVLTIAGALPSKTKPRHVLEEVPVFVGRLLGKDAGYPVIRQLERAVVYDLHFPHQETENILPLRRFKELRGRKVSRVLLGSFPLQFAYEFSCIHSHFPFYPKLSIFYAVF